MSKCIILVTIILLLVGCNNSQMKTENESATMIIESELDSKANELVDTTSYYVENEGVTSAIESTTEKATVKKSFVFDLSEIDRCIIIDATYGKRTKFAGDELAKILSVFANKEWKLRESGPLMDGCGIAVKMYPKDDPKEKYSFDITSEYVVFTTNDTRYYYECEGYTIDYEWFEELAASSDKDNK